MESLRKQNRIFQENIIIKIFFLNIVRVFPKSSREGEEQSPVGACLITERWLSLEGGMVLINQINIKADLEYNIHHQVIG